MKIATAFSTQTDSSKALAEAFQNLSGKLSRSPDIIFLHSSASYDSVQIMATLKNLAPNTAVHGGTSCLGAMTELGFHTENGYGLGLLGISDPEGSYGVGAADISLDPRAAAKDAGVKALSNAKREGELPAMIWIMGAPGCEEEILLGLADLFGPNIPIGGGSSGDNTVAGEWKQFANGKVFQNSVVVTTLFPSKAIAFSFHNGYDPTSKTAKVTRGGGRTILELDDKPAAEIYNDWVEGKISDALGNGGNVLMQTSLNPLGRVVGQIGNVPYFQLSHPDSVTREKGLTLFSNISVGDDIRLMQGSKESLTTRAGRVARAALQSADNENARAAGALVIYCAGCMLTVKDEMQDVVASIRSGLGEGVPFLSAFTFGEQGCFLGGENRHGNLMISVLVFLE